MIKAAKDGYTVGGSIDISFFGTFGVGAQTATGFLLVFNKGIIPDLAIFQNMGIIHGFSIGANIILIYYCIISLMLHFLIS